MRLLYHFSEDPGIEKFVPHVPPTNPHQRPGVWAIDDVHAPLYWFPRDCPRGTVWARDDAERDRLRALFNATAPRLHVTELDWCERIRDCALFAYRLDPTTFEPWPEADGQWVLRDAVTPVSVELVGDLLSLHAGAGIELRFAPNLWPFWDEVVASGLPFSGVRLSNARPRPQEPTAR